MSGEMQFELVKAALISLLGAAAAGRYAVAGYQAQSHGAEDLVKRHVSVYYRQGQYDRGRSGWAQGPYRHGMTFAIELLVAAPARMDLSVLEDEAATPQARMSALAASTEAAANADTLWDELARIAWNILIDPRNRTLGGLAGNRWIGEARKEGVAARGEFVVLAGTMDYTCEAAEVPTGEVGVAAASIDVSLETAPPDGTPADAHAGAAVDPTEV